MALGSVLRNLIDARRGLAFSEGDMTFYRVLHAASSWLLDGCGVQEAEPEPYDAWMRAMHFKTAKDDVRRTGLTPLHFAIMAGRADLVEALLDQGAPIECPSKVDEPRFTISKGNTPLVMAVEYARDGTIIELLLRRGADPRRHVDIFDDIALHYANGYGNNLQAIQAFMRHDPTLCEVSANNGARPFVYAMLFGNTQLTAALRNEYPQQFEASVRSLDVGRFANGICSFAIDYGVSSLEMFNAILDAGEPIDVYAPKCTKGAFASLVRISDLIARLRPIDKLPNAIFQFSYRTRTTALHAAASTGMLAVVDLLLARGAPINSTANHYGMTPLHLATVGGHPDIVAWLLEKGADPTIKDKRGRTALAHAIKLRREVVQPLLLAGSSKANDASVPGKMGNKVAPVVASSEEQLFGRKSARRVQPAWA